MLSKRIIPCLDVDNGRTVKGVQFQGLRDVGDPVALAAEYERQGADELVFLDISASHEGRETMRHVVQAVARELSIPFTVGGGIRTLEDALRLLDAGADKVSVNTAAVSRPELITEISDACGTQCCVLAIDAKAFPSAKTVTSGWQVLTHGGRNATGMNALAWARQAVELGAGEILLTSWDADGTQGGFDCPMIHAFATMLSVPVIASGGASGPDSFVQVFGPDGCADAALAASIFHDGLWTIEAVKLSLAEHHIPVRLVNTAAIT